MMTCDESSRNYNVSSFKKGIAKNSDSKWFSRGYLPHFDGDEIAQHVTFHLADSLPLETLDWLERSILNLDDEEKKQQRFRQVQLFFDQGYGCCIFKYPELAQLAQNSLLFFHKKRYSLHHWVVMPNHIHVLFEPIQGFQTSDIISSWKKYIARHINQELETNKYAESPLRPFWHREYWDRFIRSENHFNNVREYIHNNPVAAGLVKKQEDWMWSSKWQENHKKAL